MSAYARTYSIRFIDSLPSNIKYYLDNEVYSPKRLVKFWRRYVYLIIRNQLCLERHVITDNVRKILWINLSAPSLGDSLMDLSGRVLLQGREVHLLTDQRNASLFEHDPVFTKVGVAAGDMDDYYDVVIMDAYSPRCFSQKLKKWRDVPYVGMYGFVNGFEVHRTIYSHYRMAELLGVSFDVLRPDLSLGLQGGLDDPTLHFCQPYVTVVIGAEWEFRYYRNWKKVIDFLMGFVHVVLVGSGNGVAEANLYMPSPMLTNLVGKLSLHDTAHVISKAKFQVCADGGLWHIACGLGVPTICLFADCQLFLDGKRVMRNTPYQKCSILYSDENISDISPEDVINIINGVRDEYLC